MRPRLNRWEIFDTLPFPDDSGGRHQYCQRGCRRWCCHTRTVPCWQYSRQKKDTWGQTRCTGMACYHRKILRFLRGSCEIEALYHTTQQSIQEDKKQHSWLTGMWSTIATLSLRLRTPTASSSVPCPQRSTCPRVQACIPLVQSQPFCCTHPCCPKSSSVTQCCKRQDSLSIRRHRNRHFQSFR